MGGCAARVSRQGSRCSQAGVQETLAYHVETTTTTPMAAMAAEHARRGRLVGYRMG